VIPIGTRVRGKISGRVGAVRRHEYGENIVATDKPFAGHYGLIADGFAARDEDLEILPSKKDHERAVLEGLTGLPSPRPSLATREPVLLGDPPPTPEDADAAWGEHRERFAYRESELSEGCFKAGFTAARLAK
jgi:hypothetical protein